jgi:hypothetical protein
MIKVIILINAEKQVLNWKRRIGYPLQRERNI